MKNILTFTCLSLAALHSAHATVLSFDENVDGDLGAPAAPTVLTLGAGANSIIGQVDTNNGDTRDAFTFTIAAGQTLESVFLLSYDNPTTPGVNDGNRGFYNFDDGATSVNPSGANSASLITGRTFTFSELDGVNLLDTSDQTGGSGIADGTLGPGTFTFNIQNTSTISSYELQFNVVPEPSSALLLGLGGFGLMMRRRRVS